MPYQNNIPQATDLLSQSQADILQNFAEIKNLVDVNHATFGSANEGKHNLLSLPEQGADQTVAANEIGLYAKNSAVTGDAGLFLRNENDGDVVELTAAVKASPGYTVLPSGIILAWGTGSMNGGVAVSAAVTFHTAFPNALLHVQLTPYDAPTGDPRDYVISVINPTAAQFQVQRDGTYNGTAVYFSYLAIGY